MIELKEFFYETNSSLRHLSADERIAIAGCVASNYDSAATGDLMSKELKRKRDEATQAWENATVVMKNAKKSNDFMGSKRAHDEAEKLRVEYLKSETASETGSDDSENRLAMSAHR